MSNVFQKCWAKEVQLPVVLRLEEHLKNCWGGIQDYCKMFVGQECKLCHTIMRAIRIGCQKFIRNLFILS